MWRTYAAFMREKYSHVIIATLVVGLITGLFSAGPGFFIRRSETLLIVIMIGAMGFTIRLRSLNRALKDGWAFLSIGKNIGITFSSGMKNLPIAFAIASVSFDELAMFPVALGFVFQMITAVCFYRVFQKTHFPNPKS